MRCNEVRLWLLKSEEPATPPVPVRRHLRECARCRRRRRRLLRLEQAVRALPPPAETPGARAALLARVESLPSVEGAPQVVVPMPPPKPRRWWRALLVGVAAGLLLAAGLFLALRGRGPEPVANRGPDVAQADVLASALERHLKLAEGLPPAERFRELVGLAADLRAESLRLARRPGRGDLPVVAELYRKVMHEDIVTRAGRLVQGERNQLIAPLLEELHRAEAEADRAARDTPGEVAVSLHELADASRRAREALRGLLEGKPL